MYYKVSKESRELMLFAVNNECVYNGIVLPTINMLRKKKEYDVKKAIIGWYYVATNAAKEYNKEFANSPHVFNVTARWTAAADLEKYFREDVKEEN